MSFCNQAGNGSECLASANVTRWQDGEMDTWLPAGFVAPTRLEVPPDHHLRQIRATDVELDFAAVMASRERLWSIFGGPHGWPAASLTYEQDRADLERHEADMAHNLSFNYALFDTDEHYLAGCVYIDPPERRGADAESSFWTIDALVDTPVANSLAGVIRTWIATSWPFSQPRFIDSKEAWDDWLELDAIDPA